MYSKPCGGTKPRPRIQVDGYNAQRADKGVQGCGHMAEVRTVGPRHPGDAFRRTAAVVLCPHCDRAS